MFSAAGVAIEAAVDFIAGYIAAVDVVVVDVGVVWLVLDGGSGVGDADVAASLCSCFS